MEQLTQASKTPTKSIRIGIVRLSSFGDVVVSASKLMDFYHALAQEYDEVRIEWFVDTRFAGILEHHKAITTLHALPIKRLKSLRAVRELWRSLRALGRFDVVLDLQGLIKSAIVGRALDSREFVGFSFSSAREGLASVLYSRRVKVAYDENILVRNAAIYQCCLRDSALFGGDSALFVGDSALLKKHRLSPTASLVLRDKSGISSPRLCDRQPSLISARGLKNPDLLKKLRLRLVFSSQILESHSGFTKQAQPLESTFESPTAKQAIAVQGGGTQAGFFRTPRILEEEKRTENKNQAECEKTTENKKVDSSNEAFLSSSRDFRKEVVAIHKGAQVDSSSNAYFLSLRALLRKAWQSIQKYTNPLESTFEKTAQKAQEIQTLQKADSSDTPIFATAKAMDCHATATQRLAMTEKSTASKKVDSRNEYFLSSSRDFRKEVVAIHKSAQVDSSFSAQNTPTLSNSTKDSRISKEATLCDEKTRRSRSFFSKSGLCKPRKEIRLGRLSSGDEIPDSSLKAESLQTPSGFGWGKAHLPPSTQATLESSTYRVLFVLEASIPQKTYPIEQFATLATRMQQASTQKITFCLIYHEHKHNALSLQAMLEARNLHTCLFPPLDFNALKYVLNAMHCVIGGDTGVTHLAWALQSPQVITLLGNPQTSKGKNMRDTKLSRVLLGNPYVLSQSGSFEIASIPPESIYRVWVDLGAR
ncbi:glycosyltransferase family 9 protein [Helicobacter canis]|uniref:Lipopolysaccharide heptosyltransferase-1 n=1 Tax=Helicobacter canis TaxID=29419 RepID=A0A377J2A3_9HELI|nr:glycosyltransferase family 9 protein [Helicobacter canis]STO96364.1 lipopolysaccharide heptosyltransferase-1 [Helicobacter canis]